MTIAGEGGEPGGPHAKYERLIARAKQVPRTTTIVVHPCDESSLRGASDDLREELAVARHRLRGLDITGAHLLHRLRDPVDQAGGGCHQPRPASLVNASPLTRLIRQSSSGTAPIDA